MKSWPRRDEFVAYYNELVDASAPGRLSRLGVTTEGDVVYEIDKWRIGLWAPRIL